MREPAPAGPLEVETHTRPQIPAAVRELAIKTKQTQHVRAYRGVEALERAAAGAAPERYLRWTPPTTAAC